MIPSLVLFFFFCSGIKADYVFTLLYMRPLERLMPNFRPKKPLFR